MASGTAAALIETLASRYPDDADDLREALGELQRQKLGKVERLARLNDAQWQRLGLPMGIEALLRDEITEAMVSASPLQQPPAREPAPMQPAAAPAPIVVSRHAKQRSRVPDPGDDDVSIEPLHAEGLRSRGRGAVAATRIAADERSRARDRSPDSMDLAPPKDLERLWEQLLEDCLPPDKRPALQDTWVTAKDDHERYMMFLEYSSYLRKPEVTEEQSAANRRELEPLLRELGLPPAGAREEDNVFASLFLWMLVAVAVVTASYVYYTSSVQDPLQELQGL